MTVSPRDPQIGTVGDIADRMRFARSDVLLPGCTIFLIGAGCSISAGVPGAALVAQRMAREVADRMGVAASNADADNCYRSLVAAKKLVDCSKPGGKVDWYRVYDAMFKTHYAEPNDSRALFGRIISGPKVGINWSHLCLGELVAQRFISTVLTTNFDQLALSGIVRAGVIPVVCDDIDSLNRINVTPGHAQLVELHGSRHTYLLRNNPADVADVGGDFRASGTILELLRHATVFVAIGYGGREDGVMDLLVSSARILPGKHLFWVNHSADPEAISPKVRDFLATSRQSRLVPGQDADRFFLDLSRELGVGAPSAIARPLESLERLIADVSRHSVSDPDIAAEIAAAKAQLGRLKTLADSSEARDPSAERATRIRELRLAGNYADAYRLAVECVGSAVPSAEDRPIVEEAALAALHYGRVATERDPLANATRWFRHLLETHNDGDPAKARLAIGLGEALLRSAERDPERSGLEEALEFLRQMGTEIDRTTAPLDWAAIQNNRGLVLQTLGERESGTAWLKEAVAAYRLALEEYTRDRVPLDWAAIHNNLGNAFGTLGARESSIAWLQEAVVAYRLALEEQTRDRAPLDWAGTQNNLGGALQMLGERESGSARLVEAVAAFRRALEERTRDRVPLDWAATQNNLGNALSTLGERESDTARLEEAVVAYRLALEEYIRFRVPLDWAMTQSNLGYSLQMLGARESGTARLEQAAASYRLALEEYTHDRVPPNWATTQFNLANILASLAERTHDRARMAEAISSMRDVAEVFRKGADTYRLSMAEQWIVEMEAALATMPL